MGALEGKVALVTGAGQGIGAGIALAMAGAGAAVAALGRTKEKVVATAEEIERRGGRAVPVVCDVTDPEQVRSAVDEVVEVLGTVDALVNNAQDFCFGPLLHIDADTVEAGWRSGPLATLALMRACHPHLAGGGSILNLSSGATVAPDMAGTGVYAAVKAAISALTRAAAVEWAGDGIRVNALIPFGASPAVTAALADEETRAAVLGQVPLARIGDCETDIGPAAVYLAGDEARYVTGTTLSVDGGATWMR